MMKRLILLSISVLFLASCGQPESNESETSTEEITEQSSMEESVASSEQPQTTPVHSLNEPVSLYLDNPEEIVAEVVVTKVTDNVENFPDYITSGDYFDSNNLILIQVDYTNIAYPENFSMGLHDFQAFGEDGTQLPNINMQDGGDPVTQGRTGTSEFYIETEEPQDKLELDFIPSGSNSTIATYSVNVEH